MSEAGRKPAHGRASKSSLSIRSGSVTSPRRPGGWPRTIRSTPRRSPGSARRFPTAQLKPHDRAREEVDRLVQARTALKDVEDRIKQQGEHRPPSLVAKPCARSPRTMRAELRKLDAAIAAKIKAKPALRPSRRDHHERARARRSDGRRRDRLAARARAYQQRGRRGLVGARPTTTTAASAKATATSRADAASFAICSTCRSWAQPPNTTRCSRPTTNALSPGAKSPRSPSSPACAS